jgi:hypothetical protein
VRLTIDDGRHFVRVSPPAVYDAVVLDAFLGDSSPTHLMTREAFAAVARVLRPGGVLVINSYGDEKEVGGGAFSQSLGRTLRAVFPTVLVHDVGLGNVFFVAAARPLPRLAQHLDPEKVHADVAVWVFRTLERGEDRRFDGGLLLTDDFNPIDFHDAGNRESIRRALVANARGR